jgi:hypothetical protein
MELSTDMFFWHPEDKTFTQEISTLGVSPVYLKEGVTLLNPKTGGKEHFIHLRNEYDTTHHELKSWKFESYNNLKMTIWND